MNGRLFVLALVALLTAVGVALSSLGWVAVVAYLLVVGVAVGLAVRASRPKDDGRTCSCCTSTVFDPVEVK